MNRLLEACKQLQHFKQVKVHNQLDNNCKKSGLTSAQACTLFICSDSLLYIKTLYYIQQCLHVGTAQQLTEHITTPVASDIASSAGWR